MMTSEFSQLAHILEKICADAAQLILRARSIGLTSKQKADGSPLSSADLTAETFIVAALKSKFPDIGIVAEESGEHCTGNCKIGSEFFLVDALDGTKEFLSGGDDFTINIALIRDKTPLLGVVCAPALRQLYLGYCGRAEVMHLGKHFLPTSRRTISVSACLNSPIIIASKSHKNPATAQFIQQFIQPKLISAGSSLKFCNVACGDAHIYPRIGTTMQWDTAAGDAILRAAGGRTLDLEGALLVYGRDIQGDGSRSYSNPHFVAEGDTSWRQLIDGQAPRIE